MNPLLKTRCTKGHLMVYEDKVEVGMSTFGVHNINSLQYTQITGVDVKTTYAKIPFFSKGMATVTIFGTGDQKLSAAMVKLDDAIKAKEIINAKINSGKSQNEGGLNELEKLSELEDKGIITEEEYNAKKRQILGL